MLTHGASVQAYDAWSTVVGLRAGDRYLVVNPFFHSFGLKAGILASLIKGATIIPHAVFDVDAVMQPRRRGAGVDAARAADRVPVDPRPSPRSASSTSRRCGSRSRARRPVPVELIRRMRDELKFETVVTGYGLTEATGIATMCRHDDDPETISKTSGRAIPGTEVHVVDDDGDPVPTGEPGEVVIRGYNVMQGFVDDPEATAEAIDADGWLHTGDVGVLDERGNLRITDRKKDMFIVGGFNAYPGRDREHDQRPSRGEPGRDRRRARRAHGRGRLRVRRAAPGPDARRRRARSRGAASAWPTTRCPATCRWSTRSPSTPAARS